MPSQVTYTGKIGPGNTLTTSIFPDVRRFAMDFVKRTIEMTYVLPHQEPKDVVLDLAGGTVTLTDTVAVNQHTIVVSVT